MYAHTKVSFSSRRLEDNLIWLELSKQHYLSQTDSKHKSANFDIFLFSASIINAYTILAFGRNPSFEGDTIELNCSNTSYSLPVAEQPRLYYTWYNYWYGPFRNISNGPAMLWNGDALPGYTIQNDGKTLVIASAQFSDTRLYCSVQEEGSPYKSTNVYYSNLTIYS